MRSLRILAVCVLAAGPAQAQTLSGHWCGTGEQTNPDGSKSHWTASMRLAGAAGHMDYPSLDCGGTLTLERSEGEVHFYRERISYGHDRCIDGGLLAVEPVGTSMRWEWTGSDVKATALLTPHCLQLSGGAGDAGETARPPLLALLAHQLVEAALFRR
jgi:hypothetical protein